MPTWSDSSDWDASVSRLNTQMDETGVDHLQFSVRVEWSAAKDNTLQKAADKFKQKVSWFALVYHVCQHDEQNPGACSWDETQDYGSIPSGVNL